LFDETSWPEILRRYLIVTRAHRTPLVSLETTTPRDMAMLDNDSAGLLAGVLLGRQHFHDLPPELHLRVLRVLVSCSVSHGHL
jgi:hypothetical protein